MGCWTRRDYEIMVGWSEEDWKRIVGESRRTQSEARGREVHTEEN